MSQRTRKLGERIKEIIADQLLTLKDPRIGFVTVTDVRVSSDIAHAQVFYTVLPDDDDTRAQTAAGLASAVPAVRRELGRRLRTRNTPTVHFIDDPVAEQGRHIDELIEVTRRAHDQVEDASTDGSPPSPVSSPGGAQSDGGSGSTP